MPDNSNSSPVKTRPHTSIVGRAQRSAQAAMQSLVDDMQPPPTVFDRDKQYRVKMVRAVLVPGTDDHWLRPSEDVILSGEVAQVLRDDISAAKEV